MHLTRVKKARMNIWDVTLRCHLRQKPKWNGVPGVRALITPRMLKTWPQLHRHGDNLKLTTWEGVIFIHSTAFLSRSILELSEKRVLGSNACLRHVRLRKTTIGAVLSKNVYRSKFASTLPTCKWLTCKISKAPPCKTSLMVVTLISLAASEIALYSWHSALHRGYAIM